jgi:hypothetical protein
MPTGPRDWTGKVDAAHAGVFAYRSRAGRPLACGVTPYVERGELVVTTTLAFPAKAAAVRREGAAAVLAAGLLVQGRVEVHVDRTGAEFDRWLRAQELRKYPPARSLLSIPGHRTLFPWYVGRTYMRFIDPSVEETGGSDTATLTVLDARGLPAISPVPMPPPGPEGWSFETTAADGPACVLIHQETDGMTELRQMRLDGTVAAGRFTTAAATGSLDPQPTGLRADLSKLRHLARRAKAAAAIVDGLPSR